MKKKLIAQ